MILWGVVLLVRFASSVMTASNNNSETIGKITLASQLPLAVLSVIYCVDI